ncbi:hypothetical protein GOODEAATRI_018637, partial [Goodea atripinnis]
SKPPPLEPQPPTLQPQPYPKHIATMLPQQNQPKQPIDLLKLFFQQITSWPPPVLQQDSLNRLKHHLGNNAYFTQPYLDHPFSQDQPKLLDQPDLPMLHPKPPI